MFGFIKDTQLLTLKGVKNIQDVETEDVLVGENTLNKVTGIHRFFNQRLAQVKVAVPTNERPSRYVQKYRTFMTGLEQEYLSVCKDDNVPKWRSIEELSRVKDQVSIAMSAITHFSLKNETDKKYDNSSDDDDSKESFLRNLDNYTHIVLGMFFINGRFSNNCIELIVSNKRSIIEGSGIGSNISDSELVHTFIKNKFNDKPVCENIDEYHVKYTYMNTNVYNYFYDNVGPNNLIPTMLKWSRRQVVDFIHGLFTIKWDPSLWCPILYFKDYNVANTLYHIFNSHKIECDLHETNLNNEEFKDYSEWYNDINDYKYSIVLNHSFTLCKYEFEPNSPRHIGKYNFENIKVNNVEYKFLNVGSIEIVENKYDYVYALTLDNDNTYSVCGLVCKGY